MIFNRGTRSKNTKLNTTEPKFNLMQSYDNVCREKPFIQTLMSVR